MKILLWVFIFIQFINAQKLPIDLVFSSNAQDELKTLIDAGFYAKSNYGFLADDTEDELSLSNPFNIFIVPDKNIAQIELIDNVKKMVDDKLLDSILVSVIYAKNRPACLLEYQYKSDGFHIASLCEFDAIKELERIINTVENVIVLTSYINNGWYYTDESTLYKQLYALQPNTSYSKMANLNKSLSDFITDIKSKIK